MNPSCLLAWTGGGNRNEHDAQQRSTKQLQ
jgi:hypothetical protein